MNKMQVCDMLFLITYLKQTSNRNLWKTLSEQIADTVYLSNNCYVDSEQIFKQ